MVDVHEGTSDVGKDFYLVLKILAKVVSLPERSVRVHDHIDFYVIIRAALRSLGVKKESAVPERR